MTELMEKKVQTAIIGRSREEPSSSKHTRFLNPSRIVPHDSSTDLARRDAVQRARFAQDMGVPVASQNSTSGGESLQITIDNSGGAKQKASTRKVLPESKATPKPTIDMDECFVRKVLPESKVTPKARVDVDELFRTQRRLDYGHKSTHSDQVYKEAFQPPFGKERIPVVVQTELSVNDEACAPAGYEAVWSGKPLHKGVQLALCIGTPAKDISLIDSDRVKRGFCRPVDVRPDLVTPYKDYVSQVSEKVNDDGSIKAEFTSDKQFTATRAFMTAVFSGKERSPPDALDINLPCFDGWTTPAPHRKMLTDALEDEDEQTAAEDKNKDSV